MDTILLIVGLSVVISLDCIVIANAITHAAETIAKAIKEKK